MLCQGYTEASFLSTAPPLRQRWAALSAEQRRDATALGWGRELWENELQAVEREESERGEGKAEL